MTEPTSKTPKAQGEGVLERKSWKERRGGQWLSAYWYSFMPTGVDAIDEVLAAVAWAGKAYHNTEAWADDDWTEGEPSVVDQIQRTAQHSADLYTAAIEAKERAEANGICDACAGEGVKDCMCGGSGLAVDAVCHLRNRIFALKRELAEAKQQADSLGHSLGEGSAKSDMLASKLDALREINRELRKDRKETDNENHDLRTQLATATANLREMEADRRRLDWLIATGNCVVGGERFSGEPSMVSVCSTGLKATQLSRGTSGREAIDAALAADGAGESNDG